MTVAEVATAVCGRRCSSCARRAVGRRRDDRVRGLRACPSRSRGTARAIPLSVRPASPRTNQSQNPRRPTEAMDEESAIASHGSSEFRPTSLGAGSFHRDFPVSARARTRAHTRPRGAGAARRRSGIRQNHSGWADARRASAARVVRARPRSVSGGSMPTVGRGATATVPYHRRDFRRTGLAALYGDAPLRRQPLVSRGSLDYIDRLHQTTRGAAGGHIGALGPCDHRRSPSSGHGAPARCGG